MVTPVFAKNLKVFGLSHHDFVAGSENNVCILDEANKTLSRINHEIKANGLSDESELARRYHHEFERISHSLSCQAQAKMLGIKKLPAIVFDDVYVVYGELNIQRAWLAYQNQLGVSQ